MTEHTDRELLVMAAKACGIELFPCTCSANVFKAVTYRGYATHWNPLEDDGDALRLAVKLSLEIDLHRSGVAVRTALGHKILIDADEIKDGYAATRRAIVRAAAEIGRVK